MTYLIDAQSPLQRQLSYIIDNKRVLDVQESL